MMDEKKAKTIRGMVNAVSLLGWAQEGETTVQAVMRYGEGEDIAFAEVEEVVAGMERRQKAA